MTMGQNLISKSKLASANSESNFKSTETGVETSAFIYFHQVGLQKKNDLANGH